ncbi:hypothetical protein PFISCL1PPCAC_2746, partial [Pristionchus fissidentatus]
MSAVPLPLRMPSDTMRSTKGKKLYADDCDYVYRVSHSVGADTKLRCVKAGCGGRATIGGNGQAEMTPSTTHNHAPSDYPMEVYGARKAVKFLRGQDVAPKAAMSAVTAQIDPAIRPYMPSAVALKKGAQRLVPNLTSGNYPYVPQILTMTSDGLPFMRFNSTPTSQDGCVIFCTSSSLMRMNTNSHWSTDGTFRVAPPPYAQLFIIGIQDGHLFVPTVFSLLRSKRTDAYREVFDAVLSMGVINAPSHILMGECYKSHFEKAISNAAKGAHPNVVIKRCLFHLTQIIWRTVQSEGLVSQYKNPDVKMTIRCLAALAFLDVAEIPDYYNELVAHSAVSTPQCESVLDIFGRNYVGIDASGGVHTPLYPLEEWSVRDRILSSYHASNSAQESFNASLGGVPANCAVSRLETGLLEVANEWEEEHSKAAQSNLLLPQYRKQGTTRKSNEERRRMALANGSMGRPVLDHLKALSIYVTMN